MASQQSKVDHILDQMAGAGVVTAKKMFGEYTLYCDGKILGIVADDTLYVRPTAAGRAFGGELDEASPYPGAKPCLVIGADQLEDADWLGGLVRTSLPELPVQKPRKPKGKAS